MCNSIKKGAEEILDDLKVIHPLSQNKFAPLLSAISTIACFIIGAFALRYQISLTVYGSVGIGLTALHLINAFMVPKIKEINNTGETIKFSQNAKKVYAVGAFIIMTILYSLTMSGHISLHSMAITTLTLTSLTAINMVSLASYLSYPNKEGFKEYLEDRGANLWKPWNYLCSQSDGEGGESDVRAPSDQEDDESDVCND